MFKQRLITACVLVPFVLTVLYYAPPQALAIFVVLFILLAGWEWSILVPMHHKLYQALFIILLLGLSMLSMHWLPIWLLVGMSLWGMICVAILTYPASQPVWGYRSIVIAASLLLLPLVAATIHALYVQASGKNLIVYLLCLVWGTDIGAYAVGKACGKRKLIPAVSPGKTIEGTVGGIGVALLVALVGYLLLEPAMTVFKWFFVAVCTCVMTVFGDLFMSMLKRRCSVKDTGNIFPGHGGVLDRLDGFIAALPTFYIGLAFF